MLERIRNKNKFYWRILILGVALLLVIVVAASQYAEIVITDNLNEYLFQIIGRYTLSVSSEISSSVNGIASELSLFMMNTEKLDEDESKNGLYRIISNNGSVTRAVFLVELEEDGTYDVISPFYIRDDDDKIPLYISFLESSRAFSRVSSIVMMPFLDNLGSQTIIPIAVLGRTPCIGVIELNLSSLLWRLSKDTISGSEDFIISIYNADNLLLESTNQDRVPLSEYIDSAFLNAYRNDIGLFTYSDSEYYHFIDADSSTGLRVEVSVPISYFYRNLWATRMAIFSLGFLSICILLVVVIVTYRAMKAFDTQALMKSEARFQALQNKMRPHMLFNTLDSIAYAIEEDEQDMALSTIRSLAFVLQLDIRENRDEIPLSEDIRYIKSYVDVQRTRYRDRFSFDLDLDTGEYSPEDVVILKYSVQPLVENCFVHSVYDGAPFTEIKVEYTISDSLVVVVRNNGIKASDEKLKELSEMLENDISEEPSPLGLLSIHTRLRLRYGKEYGLSILPSDEGFAIELRHPVILP